jgi:hypothetical protein
MPLGPWLSDEARKKFVRRERGLWHGLRRDLRLVQHAMKRDSPSGCSGCLVRRRFTLGDCGRKVRTPTRLARSEFAHTGINGINTG